MYLQQSLLIHVPTAKSFNKPKLFWLDHLYFMIGVIYLLRTGNLNLSMMNDMELKVLIVDILNSLCFFKVEAGQGDAKNFDQRWFPWIHDVVSMDTTG